MPKAILAGTVHKLPTDLHIALNSSADIRDAWNKLTPLARNEYICWVISVKKPETRKQHIQRVCEDMRNNKRRPCCWIGCIHRTDKTISPSVQSILDKRNK